MAIGGVGQGGSSKYTLSQKSATLIFDKKKELQNAQTLIFNLSTPLNIITINILTFYHTFQKSP